MREMYYHRPSDKYYRVVQDSDGFYDLIGLDDSKKPGELLREDLDRVELKFLKKDHWKAYPLKERKCI